ncbi:MAG: formate dehydrogenase accessory protein FdhE [Gemmatimonadales bacterium]
MTETPWGKRRDRALHLAELLPHSRQMLEFYGRLLALQESVHREVVGCDWFDGVRRNAQGSSPRSWLEQLPVHDLLSHFDGFLADLIPAATQVLSTIAHSLRGGDAELRVDLLRAFTSGRPADDVCARLECERVQLEFFPRAFFQPVMEASARQNGTGYIDWSENVCPYCKSLPQVAVIRDDKDHKGRRYLVCALCSTEWTFPRLDCPSCRETNPDKLVYHVPDSLAHIRVEECKECRRYIKSVDLRVDGTAVPVVDDVATVELDLWSAERGLQKIQRNVLGF